MCRGPIRFCGILIQRGRIMAQLNLTLILRKRWWLKGALSAAAYCCFAIAIVNERAASAFGSWATTMIARWGFYAETSAGNKVRWR